MMMRDLAFEPEHLCLPDGRLLAHRTYGVAGGRPIFLFHGLPGSHLQAALVHAKAAALGVALVAFDRPGLGSSTFDACCTIDGLAADVADLADHLGHGRFGAIGISCGAPYALACARLLPQRVSAVGLLAGMAPMDRRELRAGQMPLLRAMFGASRVHRRLGTPFVALDALMFRADARRAVRALGAMLSAADRQLLEADPTVAAWFGASLVEAYRPGLRGVRDDLHRIARWRSDALAGIAQPVHIYQSGHDRHVPPAMGRHLARALANATLHECPDDGHLSIVVRRFADCARRVMASGD